MNKCYSFLLLMSCITQTYFISGMQEEEIRSPQATEAAGSSNLDHLGYGLKRYVLGGSVTKIVLAKHASGKLATDFKNGELSARTDFEAAIDQRFTKKNLFDPNNQQTIDNLFTLGCNIKNDSGHALLLTDSLATKYKDLQREALLKIISEHANSLQPKLAEQRDTKIRQAHEEYTTEMTKLQSFAATTARNFRYLDHRSRATNSFEIAKKENFTNNDVYEKFLISQKITSGCSEETKS